VKRCYATTCVSMLCLLTQATLLCRQCSKMCAAAAAVCRCMHAGTKYLRRCTIMPCGVLLPLLRLTC
jgi:hypothetical protein